ncbi:hypothetical protein QFW96_25325 [Saccharopolyspora sp. TS4A08]|uniref:Uncharacterized protein n=1 Tax=Saccharopolyspora ipomoeae TaxID=3042027 RepID=A0ABT6PVD1_9PSEU|nr:hypothetical protein [Saccharopolyspora sp. TS4A08]MDI2031969.1 hypothetical protein [Saccharopolyspora sp. TS4A08]
MNTSSPSRDETSWSKCCLGSSNSGDVGTWSDSPGAAMPKLRCAVPA